MLEVYVWNNLNDEGFVLGFQILFDTFLLGVTSFPAKPGTRDDDIYIR